MYTIFFTINGVEQLKFFKTFVDQLQLSSHYFFCNCSKTNFITGTVDDFRVLTSCIFVSTSFFELLQCEQLNITRLDKLIFGDNLRHPLRQTTLTNGDRFTVSQYSSETETKNLVWKRKSIFQSNKKSIWAFYINT